VKPEYVRAKVCDCNSKADDLPERQQNPRQRILRRVMTRSVKLEVTIVKSATSAAQQTKQSWSKIQDSEFCERVSEAKPNETRVSEGNMSGSPQGKANNLPERQQNPRQRIFARLTEAEPKERRPRE